MEIKPVSDRQKRADKLIAVIRGFSADFVECLERDRYQLLQDREFPMQKNSGQSSLLFKKLREANLSL